MLTADFPVLPWRVFYAEAWLQNVGTKTRVENLSGPHTTQKRHIFNCAELLAMLLPSSFRDQFVHPEVRVKLVFREVLTSFFAISEALTGSKR